MRVNILHTKVDRRSKAQKPVDLHVYIINQQRMPSLDLVEVRWSIAKGKRPNLDYICTGTHMYWRRTDQLIEAWELDLLDLWYESSTKLRVLCRVVGHLRYCRLKYEQLIF